MSLTVSKPADNGGDFKLLESGTHGAVCTWIVDLGPQEMEYQGEVSEKDRVRLRFEVPDERVSWKDGDGNEHEGPMVIWKEYTASLHEKATLRKHLEGWRGRGFTEEELAGFDLKNVLGKPCVISVVHKVSNNGKAYAQIDSISKVMKGMTVEPEGDVKFFDFDDHTEAEYNDLPEWLREKIDAGKKIRASQANRAGFDEANPPPIDDGFAEDSVPF